MFYEPYTKLVDIPVSLVSNGTLFNRLSMSKLIKLELLENSYFNRRLRNLLLLLREKFVGMTGEINVLARSLCIER